MVGPAAPPGRGWVGAPARREGVGSVHPASRPGDRSHRGLCALGHESGRTGGPAGKGFGGSAGPSRRVWAPCILLRGQATAPTGVCVRSVDGLVGPAAPPGRGWAPCILLRGQATAPTGVRVRSVDGLVGPAAPPGRVLVGAPARREGVGSVHPASRSGDRSHRAPPGGPRHPREGGDPFCS